VIEHRHTTDDEKFRALLQAVPAPDFRPAVRSSGRAGIVRAYKTGPRRVHPARQGVVRRVQERRSHLDRRHEIPYQVNKANLVGDIATAGPREERSKASPTCVTSRPVTACAS
jgi:DNA gyrase/topoisomerase IV subunit A